MQDCAYSLNVLDEAESNLSQELSSVIRRLETHAGRSEQLSSIYNALLNAQSELDEGTAQLRQFIDRQSFDPERMEELNAQLEIFHRLARKYRIQPEQLKKNMNSGSRNWKNCNSLKTQKCWPNRLNALIRTFAEG